jgi:hypothetical protein
MDTNHLRLDEGACFHHKELYDPKSTAGHPACRLQ